MTTSQLCKLIDLDNLILQGPIGAQAVQQNTIMSTKNLWPSLCFPIIAAIPRWKLEAKLDNFISMRDSCRLILHQIQHFSGLFVSVITIILITRLTFHMQISLSELVVGRTDGTCPHPFGKAGYGF
jgi:hypothetical protein